jgi:DNA-binding NarL/FixJ family response regulator
MKARIPGASGTLGIDRIIGAHFLVVLRDYSGPDEKTLEAMSRVFSVTFPGSQPPAGVRVIHLKLNSDNPNLIREGMKIRVTGYTVNGDEGDTWTRYDKLKILSAPNPISATGACA